MYYKEKIREIFLNILGDYDYEDNSGNIIRFLYCPLGCQGYSKNKKGHFEVNFEKGVCYCHRCYEGTTLLNIIRIFIKSNLLKENDNIKSILRDYNKYYQFDNTLSDKKNHKYIVRYKDLEVNTSITIEINNIILDYLKHRFLIKNKKEAIFLLRKFKLNCKGNFLWYSTYFNRKKVIYKIFNINKYHKYKKINKKISFKYDYYYNIIGVNNKKLIISESLNDLISFYLASNSFYAKLFNYLSLNGKSFRNLYSFLFLSGHFYYDEVYYIMDNDTKLDRVIKLSKELKMYRSNPKFWLYNKIYLIRPKSKYLDLNKQYMNNDFNFICEKII